MILNSFKTTIPYHKIELMGEMELKQLIAKEFAKELAKARIIEQIKTNTLDGVIIESFFTN